MIDYFKIYLQHSIDKLNKIEPQSPDIKKYIKKLNKNKSKLNKGDLKSVLQDLIDTDILALFFKIIKYTKEKTKKAKGNPSKKKKRKKEMGQRKNQERKKLKEVPYLFTQHI